MQLLVPLLVAAALQATIAGFYQAQQMEVGAALELQKTGHFRYQLDYGAVSEQAEGDWTFDGKTVRLSTRPKPMPPSFDIVRDDPAPEGEVTIVIEPPGFGAEGYRIDAIGTDAASGEKGLVTTDDQGRVQAGGHKLSAIQPLVPVYSTPTNEIPLAAGRGHRLLLRFHANDLGQAAFDREPLQLTPRGLVLNRYETEIRFLRVSH